MTSSKIVCRVIGGLGNQLFSFAAARRLALVNNAELVIDNVSGFAYDDEYKRQYQLDHFSIQCRKATPSERLEPMSRARRYLKRALSKRLPFEKRSYLVQEGVDFDPRLLTFKPLTSTYIEGYWQSEDYFLDVASTIREDLVISAPTDRLNLDLYEKIRSCVAVATHVRFFDEPNADGVNNADGKYYERAIRQMEEIAPGAHYFIFSDRPLAARERIPLPDDRITLVSHNVGDENAYADMWLMTKCHHFIIANSTFSWWAAWLANNKTKQIIAPGFEMRHGKMWWGFSGLIPKGWIKA